jgi:hypothetical protein
VSEPSRPMPRARGRGFAARLQDASLWDLVQFECLRRATRVVRVASGGQVAFLFFRDGNVVHATAGRLAGEAAVREVLEWQEGVFETWGGPMPEKETIDKPWQRLLLEVAQARDEAGAPNVLAFPARETAAPRPSPGIHAAALTPDGKLVRGDQSSELPAAAAYAVELAELIGESMGLDGFASLEATFEGVHYLVGRAANGNVVAARAAKPEQLEAARRELGL